MDVTFLSALYETTPAPDGGWASAYVDTTREDESGAHELDLRWKAVRGRLAEQGADEPTLQAMDEVVGTHTEIPGRKGQAVFATGGRVVLDRVLSGPPRREVARFAPLPHTMPLLAQAPSVVPHVVVVADRVRADVRAYGMHGDELAEEHVEGADWPIRKVSAGGWRHLEYHHSAEDTWTKNAKQVADVVESMVRTTAAALVVVAGDVRAREKLREHVGDRTRDVLVEIDEGGSGAGSSQQALAEAVDRAVSQTTAYRDQGLLDRFEQERGQHDRAAEGIDATLDALRRAQVDTLLVVDDSSSDAQLWVGPESTDVSRSSAELEELGVTSRWQDGADAALVRAAFGTGARVLVLTPGEVELTDGVAALLRYSDASTAH